MKLGMKNWLFFGSENAGHNAAAIYTLVENCKVHDLPVEAYLKELLTVLPGVTDPEVIASLTPARIAAVGRRPVREPPREPRGLIMSRGAHLPRLHSARSLRQFGGGLPSTMPAPHLVTDMPVTGRILERTLGRDPPETEGGGTPGDRG
jgi:hypothetical protein